MTTSWGGSIPGRFIPRLSAVLALLVLLATACGPAEQVTGTGGDDDGGPAAGDDSAAGRPGQVTMARATWDTGFMQAYLYQQLLIELGYDVSDPSQATVDANVFYPALARGEYDFWVNGWFPLHDIFLQTELVTGQQREAPVSKVGFEIRAGALQGYLVDARAAEEMNLTSMSDFTRQEVADAFDSDGDGRADLLGCNEGWGCNTVIAEHLETLDWGPNVEQIVGDYSELIDQAVDRVEAGEPVLFYTWTPNWTVDVLVPGEDVVWLESSPLPEEEDPTEVDGLDGCAGDQPCQLGWVANDIRVVANNEFLDANPSARTLFELVEIPLDDIAEQNARMNAAGNFTESDIAQDATAWIEENRETVDGWLEQARSAS